MLLAVRSGCVRNPEGGVEVEKKRDYKIKVKSTKPDDGEKMSARDISMSADLLRKCNKGFYFALISSLITCQD